MKKNIFVLGLIAVAGLSLCGCGGSKEKETFAYETATAPETTEAETDTEEETVMVDAINPEEYAAADTRNMSFIFEDFLSTQDYYTAQEPPAVGERNTALAFFAQSPDENNQSWALTDDFRTVTLPEWGIAQLTVDSEIFPDDEANVLKLDERYIKRRNLTADELKSIGKAETDEVSVLYYDNEKGIVIDRDAYDDIENVCYDLSPLYPGSLTRSGEQAFFQVYVTKTDLDMSPENLEKMTSWELFEKLYPYGSYDYNHDKEESLKYHAFGSEEATYIYWQIQDANSLRTAHSTVSENYLNEIRNGFLLVRVKDGICEGIMYKSKNGYCLQKGAYILGTALNLYDMDMIKETPCERYIEQL